MEHDLKPGEPVDRVTGSISDGKPIDWEGTRPGGDLDGDTLQAFRDVERIAEFNRSLQHTTEGDPPTPGSGIRDGKRPERWGDLIVLEPIGAGARGKVWRAWDSTLQRQVALKFLQPAGEKGTGRKDLLNEARSLAKIRHKGVVTVHGIAENDDRAGMWMECLEGPTLAREIERMGKLDVRQVTHIASQLCSALEALEAAGLVHGDIKPSNIVLEAGDRVVLTDFGLGWRPALGDIESPRGSGTPMFMAPELFAGAPASHASDRYALGVTLWYALAGEPPYRARALHELRDALARGPSRSLQKLRPDAPAPLIASIMSAMSADVSKRPNSAAEFASRIREESKPVGSSIAVLPFLNRSQDRDEEYFSEGLSDELLQMLTKIRGLRVAARSSAYSFKGRQATIGEIGRALQVAAVLEGSVRKSGDRVRISVQLVNVFDGYHLWSETYDRTLQDIFAVQDDIAQSVVKELRAVLLAEKVDAKTSREVDAEVAKAARGRATDPEAYRLYLLGRHFARRLSRQDMTKGIEYLKQALARDPNFAFAWAELAGAYSRAAGRGLIPHAEGYAQAREAVRRALAIEPDLGEAHARLASIQMFYDFDLGEADRSYARALELAPGDIPALSGAGVLAFSHERADEAIALHRRACEQDPLSAAVHSNLGLSLHRAGRLEESEAAYQRAIELDPNRYLTRSFLARVLTDLGRAEEAMSEASREPDPGQRLYMEAILHWLAGNGPASEAALHELIATHGEGYAFQIAEAYGVRGDADGAFEWLDRAYTQRDAGLVDLKSSINLRPIQGDRRFREFAKKLGLGDAQP